MAKAEEPVDAPKLAWERVIAEQGAQIAAAMAAEIPQEQIQEMSRIKQFIVDAYKLRFGDPFPEVV